jgi:hypothetical protein
LEAIATEANHLRCQLKVPEAKQTLEQIIWRSLFSLLQDPDPAKLEAEIKRLGKLLDVGQNLKLGLALDRCQELFFNYLHTQIELASTSTIDSSQLEQLLPLGEKLGIDINRSSTSRL